MKKIVNIMIYLMLLSMPFITTKAIATNSPDINYVRIYYFYSDDCKECESGKEWLKNLSKDDYRLSIEYINNDENLNTKVKKSLNIKSDELPLIVIGTTYFVGFNKKTENNLTKAIESYGKEEYCDSISKIRKDQDIKSCIDQNKKIYKQITSFSLFAKVIIALIGIVLIAWIIIIIKKKLKK